MEEGEGEVGEGGVGEVEEEEGVDLTREVEEVVGMEATSRMGTVGIREDEEEGEEGMAEEVATNRNPSLTSK